MNIIDYVKKDKGELDLDNEIDALVLSQSIYFSFEEYLGEKNNNLVKLSDLKLQAIDKKPKNKLKRNHYKLVQLMLENQKYSKIEILDFIYIFNEDVEQQFAAITYRVDKDALFIAFRGTDSTILGWKEDLNMSFIKNIPSQVSGKEYIDKILMKYDGKVYVGGHSKGGNIAVYASAFCDELHKSRVNKIYNFDGPGFHSEMLEEKQYLKILPYTCKYVPSASIIGKLMDTKEIEIVVKSKQVSIFQHDSYTWLLMNNEFKRSKNLSPSSKKIKKTLKIWLENIPAADRKYVIDEVYLGLTKLGLDDYDTMSQYVSIENIKNAVSVYNDVNPQLKRYIKKIARQFLLILIDVNKS